MKLLLNKVWHRLKKSGLFMVGIFGGLTLIGMGAVILKRSETKEVISLVLSTRNNPFFTDIEMAVRKEMGKHGEYELNVFDSQDDDNKQKENISNALALNSKAIIINVVNSATAWYGSLEEVAKRKIPIFAIDRSIESPLGKINQTIASNNIQGAKDIAAWFKEKYKGVENANIFHLNGVAGSQAAKDRSKGFKQGFGKDYLVEEIADFSRSAALQKTGVILQGRGEEFKIIFADNDEMALGAIEAIKQKKYQVTSAKPYKNKKFEYYVLGFDGTKEALESIKEKKLTATVIQQPKLMGELAVKSVMDFFANKKIEPNLDAETIVVSKENVDKFL